MKLTPWFSGDVKPVRDGVYQRQYSSGGLYFCMWSKGYWRFPADTPDDARIEIARSLEQKQPSWRGIAR